MSVVSNGILKEKKSAEVFHDKDKNANNKQNPINMYLNKMNFEYFLLDRKNNPAYKGSNKGNVINKSFILIGFLSNVAQRVCVWLVACLSN